MMRIHTAKRFIKKYDIIFIILISLGLGFILSNHRYQLKEEKINIEYKRQITSLSSAYRQQINEYKDKLSISQQNNIVTSTTIIKPSGEKIITKIVDKSKNIRKEKKEATSLRLYSDVNKSSFIGEDSKEFSRRESSSTTHYKLGISGIQPLTSINLTSLNITAGVRIFTLPIFLTSSFPLDFDIYKINFGIEFEF